MNKKLIDFFNVLGHDELLVGEFFSGYGSQSMSLNSLGIPNKVVITSEIDADAIIAYASIRYSQEMLDKDVDLSDDEIKKWLMDRNIGYDFTKKKSSISKMKKIKLKKLYNACILCNTIGDISLIEPNILPDMDLITYSFPCTDISVAGQQKGLSKDSGTRSSLLWECQKIIQLKKPKYLLMENVKNLLSKKFIHDFEKWCKYLEGLGYTNYYKVLNAKDYGVPQNRERVFMISILAEHEPYVFPEKQTLTKRLKDILDEKVDEKYYIDNDRVVELISKIKDDKIGSLPSGDKIEVSSALSSREHRCSGWNDISGTLCARDYKDPKVVAIPNDGVMSGAIRGRYGEDGIVEQHLETNGKDCTNTITTVQKDNVIVENKNDKPIRLGGLFDDEKGTHQAGSIWDVEALSPMIDTCQGGYRQPCVVVENKNENEDIITVVGSTQKNVYIGDGSISSTLTSVMRTGGDHVPIMIMNNTQKNASSTENEGLIFVGGIGEKMWIDDGNRYSRNFSQGNRVYDSNGVSVTQTSQGGGLGSYTGLYKVKENNKYTIRKLTPKECWRLMGVNDKDFENVCSSGISNTQLYKLAGNSIVKNCLDAIFEQLFFVDTE